VNAIKINCWDREKAFRFRVTGVIIKEGVEYSKNSLGRPESVQNPRLIT